MSSLPLRISVACLFLACALAPASAAAGERIPLRDGVNCKALAEAAADGATHACYFFPGKVARHDFSTRNARAGHVATLLGPKCGSIEILGEEDHVQDGGETLRRVSVLCQK